MSVFNSGDELKEIGVVLRTLIVEEIWGEIWRAEQVNKGNVLIVAFTTEQGIKLFQESRASYQKWQSLAISTCPGLLKIKKIVSESKIPLLVVEDPGGETVREKFTHGWTDLRETGKMALTCAKSIDCAKTEYLAPLGLTPDTIVEDPESGECPWRLIPVAPGSKHGLLLLGSGRYTPPELANVPHPEDVNPDIYSLLWVWTESIVKEFSLSHNLSQLKEYVPYKTLHTLLSNGLRPIQGKYFEPKLTVEAIQHWLKYDAPEDFKAYQATLATAEQTPLKYKLYEAKEKLVRYHHLLIQAGILIGVIAFIVLMALTIRQLTTLKLTTESPFGIVKLYFDALIERDVDKALRYTRGEAVLGT
ncbi:hypothetical protein J7M23_02350, partial [Candidatus Sumerlaeota bacterium]|nr:hypothetical protein [Candidatus Sumerlaeota bacterium]